MRKAIAKKRCESLNMTLIGPSSWRTADDWTGQSIDIRGRTMELLDGR
jgi:hypothetical protein